MGRAKSAVLVTIFVEGEEKMIPANEAGLTEREARLINAVREETDVEQNRFIERDRHYIDKVVEYKRSRINADFTSGESDPLDNIADSKADIFSLLFPEKHEISEVCIAVKEIISTLTESQRDFFQKHYVYGMTYEEIGKEDSVSKQAAQQKDLRLRNQVEKKLKALNFFL